MLVCKRLSSEIIDIVRSISRLANLISTYYLVIVGRSVGSIVVLKNRRKSYCKKKILMSMQPSTSAYCIRMAISDWPARIKLYRHSKKLITHFSNNWRKKLSLNTLARKHRLLGAEEASTVLAIKLFNFGI